jgi:hypothetical protein
MIAEKEIVLTYLPQLPAEDLILAMTDALQTPFHDLTFGIRDDGYHQTQDGPRAQGGGGPQ